MFKNYTDSSWLVPKLVLATYALVIVFGAFAIVELLA